MRTLVVSSFVTLDGVIQAPGGPDEDTSPSGVIIATTGVQASCGPARSRSTSRPTTSPHDARGSPLAPREGRPSSTSPTTRADLLARAARGAEAVAAYDRAIELTTKPVEREFLAGRRAQVVDAGGAPTTA